MNKGKQLIRFDWAMKKLLRAIANFDVLEGFLSEIASARHTKMVDAKLLTKKGEEKGKEQLENKAIIGLCKNNIPISIISSSLDITEERVRQILE